MAVATPTLAITDNASSAAGVTATITNADATATVTLSYMKIDAGFTNTSWTAGSDRTGNGTISQTLTTGIYWFRAVSVLATESAVSNLLFLAVTDGAEAVHELCLQGVEAGLRTLAAAGSLPGVTVASRVKSLTELRMTALDLPAVVCCTNLTNTPGPPELLNPKVNVRDDIGYPVYAVYVTRASGGDTEDRNDWLKVRQVISRYFRHQHLGLSVVPTVYTCTPEMGPPLQFMQDGQLQAMGSVLILRFWSREPRG